MAALGGRSNVRAVELYLRVRGLRPNVHFGMYEIPAQASPAQILEMFEQGLLVKTIFTLIFGMFVYQLLTLFFREEPVEATRFS